MTNLKEKYPKIFENIHWANYGFPETWTDLIDNLCKEIQDYCDLHDDFQVRCVQVKEKFGGLRFYVEESDSGIDEIIRKYEKQSIKMCQQCGCTDKEVFVVGSWIKYWCQPCIDKSHVD